MTLWQANGTHFLAVNCGWDWSFGDGLLLRDDDFPTSCQNVECSTHRPKRVHQARQKLNMREREHGANPTFKAQADDQSLEHLQEAAQVQNSLHPVAQPSRQSPCTISERNHERRSV
jgi:hypothetical protein